MLDAALRAAVVPRSPPSDPRLLLAKARAGQAVLDGGWWPRSWDPVAELPGLVRALSKRYGRIRSLMLNSGAWDGHFRRLAVGADPVRVAWFASLDAALVIAVAEHGEQIDLLVVPPSASTAAAELAMTTAADPTNLLHAPAILAAGTTELSTAGSS
jgi:hypothetical protein